MIAVLIDSRRDGCTGRVATRGMTRVRVEGMSGCHVEIDCGVAMLQVFCDGEYELPEGVEFVQAFHSKTKNGSRVFVDLVE